MLGVRTWRWVRAFLIHHVMARQIGQSRHRRGERFLVRAKSILGGLHHEYFVEPMTA